MSTKRTRAWGRRAGAAALLLQAMLPTLGSGPAGLGIRIATLGRKFTALEAKLSAGTLRVAKY